MKPLSRREFVAAAAVGIAAARPVSAGQRTLTAAEIIERIRANVGVPWNDKTVDGLKTGDASAVVTGIAVAVMPTLDVLGRAAADGLNFIVVQEPTFYAPNEAPGGRATDPVYLAKRQLIDDRNLVIYRLSDHWNARRPHPGAVGLAEVLGYTPGRAADSEFLYSVPPATLGAVVDDVRRRLSARAVRVIGDPGMPVRRVFVSPGTTDVPSVLGHLSRADVVISGEPREWEAVPYIQDSRSAGLARGMVIVGRVVSEWPGARIAAVWLRSLVSEVPVTFVSLPDPYWSPSA
jgi:putative NIF3 family GTP cyclohydrolase 1 type 2